MATTVILPGSETIDFNLKVENAAKYYYSFETWTPIMGALLMSGIVPTDYWTNALDDSEHSEKPASFWVKQFDKLLHGLWKIDEAGEESIPEHNQRHLRGLDGEMLVTTGSARFLDARRVLRHWDNECEDEAKYELALEPFTFLAWLEELCRNEEIRFFDRVWLDVFLKLNGLESNRTILPTSVVESFQKLTDIGDEGRWHPLDSDIVAAQREAVSEHKDRYAIEVIFPRVIRILLDRDAIDRSNKEYVPGKTLPVKMEDGSLYILKRDSLRVQLNRLKAKHFAPPQ
ncbi:hypothetical protein [Paraburkholderia sp. BCC1885]|uniref:hypothetical protein n=1 Tax=Paraburkholderia sp. BCC1885 TaxID=2562669 RepID=UPI00118302BC|nr:hypothetical protein [Paraburkholderia sp. BCC1885]